MTVGERLRYLRKDLLKMTLDSFGNEIGLKKSALSHIETGAANLTDQTRRSICREFGVNEQWLLTGEGEPFPKKTRKEEIAEFIDSLSDDDTFKTNLIAVLAKLSPEKWKVLEEVAQKIVAPSQFEEGDSAQDTASGVAAAEAEYIKNVSENARRQGAPASSSTEEGSEGETA